MAKLLEADVQRLAEEGGIPAAALETARSELAEKWGHEPAPGDVFWSAAVQHKLWLAQTDATWRTQAKVPLVMAKSLEMEGKGKKDIEQHLVNFHKASLKGWKSNGCERVVVGSLGGEGCCSDCDSMQGEIHEIKDEVRRKTLPRKECSAPMCRCVWDALPEDQSRIEAADKFAERAISGVIWAFVGIMALLFVVILVISG